MVYYVVYYLSIFSVRMTPPDLKCQVLDFNWDYYYSY